MIAVDKIVNDGETITAGNRMDSAYSAASYAYDYVGHKDPAKFEKYAGMALYHILMAIHDKGLSVEQLLAQQMKRLAVDAGHKVEA